MGRNVVRILALVGTLVGAVEVRAATPAARAAGAPFTVPGEVALAALASLGDAHLVKLADALTALAATPAARGGRWEEVREPLSALAKTNVEAQLWLARPDGSYWSLARGKEEGNLSSRAYFPRLLRGETVLGSLVVSKSTGRSSAIVAVPVRGADGKIAGALGGSVYLEQLGQRLKRELALPDEFIFYSFDATPIVALDWDPHLVLADPAKLGPDVERAFQEMLRQERGTVRYTFRDQPRTVIFRRSPVTGWWYALGTVAGGTPVR